PMLGGDDPESANPMEGIKPEMPGMDKMGAVTPKLGGGGDGPEAAVGGAGAVMTDAMKSSGKDQLGTPTQSDTGPAEGMSKGLSMSDGKGPESQMGNGLESISKELSGLANKVTQMDAQQLVQELDKLLNTAQSLTSNNGLSNGMSADSSKVTPGGIGLNSITENKSSMPSTRFGGDQQIQEPGAAVTNALGTKMSPIENIS
ncbi:MAG TPA: hypothetical protein PLD88_00330, partial [Candidatus Berkiella sp.]|nr:hypothetical protein [Candidatus Berkiella sp.]